MVPASSFSDYRSRWRLPARLVRPIVAVAGLLLAAWLSASAVAQGQVVAVDSRRAVSDALNLIEAACLCVITFEDPQWESGDVDDITREVVRDPNRVGPPILAPKRTRLVIPQPSADGLRNSEQVRAAVQYVLNTHDALGGSHVFTVGRSELGWHVYPRAGSILDNEVVLDGTEDSALNALHRVLSQIKANTGLVMVVGTFPVAEFADTGVDIAVRDKASKVIPMLFTATGRKISWRLHYDFSDRQYYLNARAIDGPRCYKNNGKEECTRGDADAPRKRPKNPASKPTPIGSPATR